MKWLLIIFLLIIPFFSNDICNILLFIISFIWLIFYVRYLIITLKTCDKKVIVDDCITELPNNTSSYNIRYLYKAKKDTKIFILHILELLVNKQISIKSSGQEFYIINRDSEVELTKSEEKVKSIIFDGINNSNNISLTKLRNLFRHNSGYMYNLYNDFMHTFTYEATKLKYFKTIKNLEDRLMFFLVFSVILSVYNLLFINIWIFILMFIFITILIILVNNCVNREDLAEEELKKWLRLKNYIKRNPSDVSNLDTITLERYALYSYALDIDNFSEILSRCTMDKIKDSELLVLMKNGLFDIIVEDIVKNIEICRFNVNVLFKKNKGRRD